MRILLTIEYDGTNYAGWQRQSNALSVQQVIEEAFFAVAGEKVSVVGAGRTDAGVHAVGQCAHADINTSIPPEKIAYALNLALPRDIRIKETREVREDFHARRDAHTKHYRYCIINAPHDCAVGRNYCTHVRFPLDVDAMRIAAGYIKGVHDFKCFQAAGSTPVESTVRNITDIDVTRVENMIYIDVCGTGFLYNMVRIIAGTLIEVGSGRRSPHSIPDVIASRDRSNAGPTAAAKGLILVCVNYAHNSLIQKTKF